MNDKQSRLENANKLLVSIASCGRQFFYHKGNVSQFELDSRGRVWFIDGYNGTRVYTHYTLGSWRGFSEGGTLRELVIALRDYIVHGDSIGHTLGPFAGWYCEGDPWGYGSDMQTIRQCADRLGIARTQQTLPAELLPLQLNQSNADQPQPAEA
jgi:hypothetical protein